jgi:hypothetical protein
LDISGDFTCFDRSLSFGYMLDTNFLHPIYCSRSIKQKSILTGCCFHLVKMTMISAFMQTKTNKLSSYLYLSFSWCRCSLCEAWAASRAIDTPQQSTYKCNYNDCHIVTASDPRPSSFQIQ